MNPVSALKRIYNQSYSKRPILTLCITNCVLGGLSDCLAQSITYYEYHHSEGGKRQPDIMDNRLPENIRSHQDLYPEPAIYEFSRTARFALYNFSIAPVVGTWYMTLDRYFPMPPATAKATDQVFFAPLGLAIFFTVMGLAESGKWEGVQEKFRDAFKPALMANYTVWPLVQLINFKFMPLQYRLPFVSALGILWNAYLSWINNASKEEEKMIELQKSAHQ
ncbi:putative integral membrane protein, Mpv17/PMP22 family [Dichotomocladium elegans]|nr:putative integral membrane protein, Mpv17/PMP22 family [Dichotomocladium elegans]